jgi:hypothetical protein
MARGLWLFTGRLRQKTLDYANKVALRLLFCYEWLTIKSIGLGVYLTPGERLTT